jgi:hypothetical protein
MLHIILSTQNLSNLKKLDLSGHLIASSLAEFNRQLEKLGHAYPCYAQIQHTK